MNRILDKLNPFGPNSLTLKRSAKIAGAVSGVVLTASGCTIGTVNAQKPPVAQAQGTLDRQPSSQPEKTATATPVVEKATPTPATEKATSTPTTTPSHEITAAHPTPVKTATPTPNTPEVTKTPTRARTSTTPSSEKTTTSPASPESKTPGENLYTQWKGVLDTTGETLNRAFESGKLTDDGTIQSKAAEFHSATVEVSATEQGYPSGKYRVFVAKDAEDRVTSVLINEVLHSTEGSDRLLYSGAISRDGNGLQVSLYEGAGESKNFTIGKEGLVNGTNQDFKNLSGPFAEQFWEAANKAIAKKPL